MTKDSDYDRHDYFYLYKKNILEFLWDKSKVFIKETVQKVMMTVQTTILKLNTMMILLMKTVKSLKET